MNVLLMIGALLGFPLQDARVPDHELGFTIVVPVSFVEDEELIEEPHVVYAWYEPRRRQREERATRCHAAGRTLAIR